MTSPAKEPAPRPHTPSAVVHSWLGSVGSAEPLRLGRLTVWPLTRSCDQQADVDLMHEALGSGTLSVTEKEVAEVPHVQASNKGQRPVLILEGELLSGAHQDRVVVDSLVLNVGEVEDVSVGCIESGRWSGACEAAFGPSELPVDPEIRGASTAESLRENKVDQRRLWRDVEDKLSWWRTHNATSCYTNGMRGHASSARGRARKIEPLPDQVGVLVTRADELVGIEVLSSPKVWQRAAHRLLPSYLLVDIASDGKEGAAVEGDAAYEPQHDAAWWLKRLAGCKISERRGGSKGVALALEGDGICGRGLADTDGVLHLAAFAAPPTASSTASSD